MIRGVKKVFVSRICLKGTNLGSNQLDTYSNSKSSLKSFWNRRPGKFTYFSTCFQDGDTEDLLNAVH